MHGFSLRLVWPRAGWGSWGLECLGKCCKLPSGVRVELVDIYAICGMVREADCHHLLVNNINSSYWLFVWLWSITWNRSRLSTNSVAVTERFSRFSTVNLLLSLWATHCKLWLRTCSAVRVTGSRCISFHAVKPAAFLGITLKSRNPAG